MTWSCRLLAALLAAAFAATARADMDIAPSGLTKAQARQVLLIVLKHEKYRLSDPGMYINGDLAQDRPGYYDFSLSYDNPKAGATAHLGYYSVNIKTGDVWEVDSCIRYRFAKLGALQRKIIAITKTPMADDKMARDEVGCPPLK